MARLLMYCVVIITVIGLEDIFGPTPATGCNEAVCASIVSKCMLTQSCKCDLQNCTCCKECFTCLSYLYSECCSCVEMCPKPNATTSALSKTSHVEEFEESIPGLFQALMSPEPDPQNRWITFIFPVDYSRKDAAALEKRIKIAPPEYPEQEVDPVKDVVTLNCTVAYMSQCMSWNKCKQSCRSTGASSYRWFHDGCCECVGLTCRNYGINESRCLQCPHSSDVDDGFEDYDYGSEDAPTSAMAVAAAVARQTTGM